MLDENLPTFYLKTGTDTSNHHTTILLSQYGSEAAPTYTLRYPDPASADSKNRYAAALYDSYNPEILFCEVLLIPKWTQPSLSQEEIRKNGGIPPPPQPILPTEFTIQLYNPDQQILVKQNPGSWNTTPYWEFGMPQQTFRQPSTSALDRTQSDPTASETTPKINFKWKKEGKFSKDLICNLSGKSSTPEGGKRKNREPDIAVSLFRNLREVTIYEPNLSRVDIEDPKGLEVVLLLSAAVIRDVYFGQMRETFNIQDSRRPSGGEATLKKPPGQPTAYSSPPTVLASQKLPQTQPQPHRHHHHHHHHSNDDKPPVNQQPPPRIQSPNSRPPPTDPRSQWEIDAETARLRKQVEQEEKERKIKEKSEEKHVKRLLEAEQKEAARKQATIDAETERLRRAYAEEQRQAQRHKHSDNINRKQRKPQLPPRQEMPQRHSAPPPASMHGPWYRPPQQPNFAPSPALQPARPTGPYLQPPQASSVQFMSQPRPQQVSPRRSFFGLRSSSDQSAQKLAKKKSSLF